MSSAMNKVFLYGNLGADPELKVTAGGEPKLKLRLATNQKWRDRESGELRERTDWHNVAVWGKRANALYSLLHKGDRLMVEGEIRNSTYEKDGRMQHYSEVRARDVFLASGGRRRSAGELPIDAIAEVHVPSTHARPAEASMA